MNNLNELKNLLSLSYDAKKQLFDGLALYKFKALFDGLIISDMIDFSSEHGLLLKIVLKTNRRNDAMKNIVFVCSSLESTIKKLDLAQADLIESQKQQDELAIESTCVTVTSNENKEIQLQLSNMPKKIGRPKLASSLTGRERAKRARDKKKASKLVTVNSTLTQDASRLYSEMIKSGYDLSSIIEMAYKSSLSNC